MTPITTTTEIDRPADQVFDYATDPETFHQWQQGVIDGRMEHTGPEAAIGDLCITTRRIGGANRASTSRLTHLAPHRSWGVRGVDGPIRAIVDLTVEPLSETRSRLTISVDFQGRGIGKLLVPLIVRRQARKEMPKNLAALKQRLESPDDSS